ncbi:YveK family protein [Corticicoccus populi]|uniref:YveK family protein n=1 Tax=Corticicoccus populi TaxID=1812821 RepID=A0ABW5WUH7_9STAP
MVNNMSFEEIINILKRYSALILLMTAGFMLAAFLITFFLITPKYEANTQILISESETNTPINNQSIETSLQLINTYRDIILSPLVLDDVIEQMNLGITSDELAVQLTVSQADNSQVLNVTAVDDRPETAADISNEVSNVFHQKVLEIMNVDNVTIISPARLETDPAPIFPNTLLNVAAGGMAGGVIAVVIAFLRAVFDTKVRNEEDVRRHLDLPVLGSIAKFDK